MLFLNPQEEEADPQVGDATGTDGGPRDAEQPPPAADAADAAPPALSPADRALARLSRPASSEQAGRRRTRVTSARDLRY